MVRGFFVVIVVLKFPHMLIIIARGVSMLQISIPYFFRSMSIASHKLRISRQIILNRSQICLFLMKNKQFLEYDRQILQLFSTLL